MNGSGANTHTVSPKQAKRLVDDFYSIICSFRARFESSINQFIIDVSKQWEDENAVTFVKTFKGKIDSDFYSQLEKKGNWFLEDLSNVINEYAKAGNKVIDFTLPSFKFSSGIDIMPVKTTFDGDRFGLDNESKSIEILLDSLANLRKDILSLREDLGNKVRSVNVFGNAEVRKCFTISSYCVVEFGKGVWNAFDYARETLLAARHKYTSVSSSYVGGSAYTAGGTNGSARLFKPDEEKNVYTEPIVYTTTTTSGLTDNAGSSESSTYKTVSKAELESFESTPAYTTTTTTNPSYMTTTTEPVTTGPMRMTTTTTVVSTNKTNN